MRVALFGLGEAGAAIGADLVVAGVEVHGYDPQDVATPPGVVRHATPDAVTDGCDLVLAVTATTDAPAALHQALDGIPRGVVYADLATSAARLKERLAAEAEGAGLRFVDVALMSPVGGKGLRTPTLASGSGAAAFIEMMGPLGMPVESAGERAGAAATRKLLRSVVIKGLATLVIESMEAAEAAGYAEETWENLVAQFTAADEVFVRRMVEGTAPHALRRLHEMEATAELLGELGVDPLMTRATVESLRRIDAGAPTPTLPTGHTGTPSSSQ